MRDLVNERLSSALSAAAPVDPEAEPSAARAGEEPGVITTEEELSGYRIVQAIAAKLIDPKRVTLCDSKSYCAILIDDNNRKTLARLHFNGLTTKYVGTFVGKEEQRHLVSDLTQIYQLSAALEARIKELDAPAGMKAATAQAFANA